VREGEPVATPLPREPSIPTGHLVVGEVLKPSLRVMPDGRHRCEGRGPVAGEDVWEAEALHLRWLVRAGKHIAAFPFGHQTVVAVHDPKVEKRKTAFARRRRPHDVSSAPTQPRPRRRPR